MASIYPNSVFSWQPRVDDVNIVYANDPNTLATEIAGIESAIGTNPGTELNPPAGSAVQYPNLNARVSAAMNNAELPYAVLQNPTGCFLNAGQQRFHSYSQVYDPYKMWNGQDLTIPCSGYWSIRADQRWSQRGNEFNGLNFLFLYLNGNWCDCHVWNWADCFTFSRFGFPSNIFGGNGFGKVNWEGLLNKGDRIQGLSSNGTNCPGVQALYQNLKIHCVRTVSGNFISG